MRAIIAALAALGGGVILATGVVSVTTGDASELYWLIVGPLPFLVLGVAGFLRQPENRMVWWLVGVGAAFGCDTALGDVFLPMAETHWGVTSSATEAIALLEHWCAVAGPVAAVGLFGLFPSGRPERAYERVVIWTVVLAGFLLPLLEAVSEASIAPAGGPPDNVAPVVYPSLWVPALAPLGGPAEAAYRTFPAWPVIGVALLALRYRHTDGAQRRKIRWLFLGMAVSASLWIPPPCFVSWPTRTTRPPRPRARRCRPGACHHPGVDAGGDVLYRGIRYRRARAARVRAPGSAGIDRRRARRPGHPGRRAGQPGRAGRGRRGGRGRRRGLRARPFGAVWSTPRTAGCSARGWRATPASAASARA